MGSYIEKRAEIHAASQLRPGDFAPILAIEANKVYRGRNTPYEQIDVRKKKIETVPPPNLHRFFFFYFAFIGFDCFVEMRL